MIPCIQTQKFMFLGTFAFPDKLQRKMKLEKMNAKSSSFHSEKKKHSDSEEWDQIKMRFCSHSCIYFSSTIILWMWSSSCWVVQKQINDMDINKKTKIANDQREKEKEKEQVSKQIWHQSLSTPSSLSNHLFVCSFVYSFFGNFIIAKFTTS